MRGLVKSGEMAQGQDQDKKRVSRSGEHHNPHGTVVHLPSNRYARPCLRHAMETGIGHRGRYTPSGEVNKERPQKQPVGTVASTPACTKPETRPGPTARHRRPYPAAGLGTRAATAFTIRWIQRSSCKSVEPRLRWDASGMRPANPAVRAAGRTHWGRKATAVSS